MLARRKMLVLALIVSLLVSTLGFSAIPVSAATKPEIKIVKVVEDKQVYIEASNLPASTRFSALMTIKKLEGVAGIVVGTAKSDADGYLSAVFRIPAALQDHTQLALRLQSSAGFYAFNWFDNYSWENKSGSSGGSGSGSGSTTTGTAKKYTGFPSIQVNSVVKDDRAVVTFKNLPPGQRFIVRMGPTSTRAEKGIQVGFFNSGKGGSLTAVYKIPAAYANSYRIAIRLESSTSGYYAFNWFYNR